MCIGVYIHYFFSFVIFCNQQVAGWPSGLRRQFKALVFGRGFESHFSHNTFFPKIRFFISHIHNHIRETVCACFFHIPVFVFHRSVSALGGKSISELSNNGVSKLKDVSKGAVKRRTTTSPKKVLTFVVQFICIQDYISCAFS